MGSPMICGLQREQARGDRAHQERRLGMHRHRGARINCVYPGMIDGRMLSTILQDRCGGAAYRRRSRRSSTAFRRAGSSWRRGRLDRRLSSLPTRPVLCLRLSFYTVDGGRTAA